MNSFACLRVHSTDVSSERPWDPARDGPGGRQDGHTGRGAAPGGRALSRVARQASRPSWWASGGGGAGHPDALQAGAQPPGLLRLVLMQPTRPRCPPRCGQPVPHPCCVGPPAQPTPGLCPARRSWDWALRAWRPRRPPLGGPQFCWEPVPSLVLPCRRSWWGTLGPGEGVGDNGDRHRDWGWG